MKIPVFVNSDYISFYKSTNFEVVPTVNGVSIRSKITKLIPVIKTYGIEDYPCNMATLPVKMQKRFIDSYRDDNGCFLSTKAFNDAKKINYINEVK